MLFGQKAKPAPDTLIFSNGEQLTGSLKKADAKGITFDSPVAGTLTVKWANIKELQTVSSFAVLPANQHLTRRDAESIVPQGKLTIAEQTITVATTSGDKEVPVKSADQLIESTAFNKALQNRAGLLDGWAGTAQGGASLVRATQNSTSFNGGISLVRTVPQISWLPARSRTSIDYTQSYGTVSQPATTPVETNIFHAEAEQDRYVTPRAFAFVSATFDHNFSSNLDLQSAYGGGAGLTLLKNAVRTLDLKADAHYEKLTYFDNLTSPAATTQNQNLFGSTFSEKYLQYLPHGLVLNEFGSLSPSWYQSDSSASQPNAYSAHVNASLGFPLFKGLGFSLGLVDDYLNNAPVGSQRNSTQFNTNLTYTIRPR